MRTLAAAAGLVLALGPGAAGAEPGPPPPREAGPAVEAARLYLGQSLSALIWALRYARQAGQLGPLEGFDLRRYVEELDTVAAGVERYLHPQGPPPGPAPPVEITGQFLADGLARALAPARAAPPPGPATPAPPPPPEGGRR